MSFFSMLGTQLVGVVKSQFQRGRKEYMQRVIASPEKKLLYHVHARTINSMVETIENAIDSFMARYGQMPSAIVVSSLERLELPANEWHAFQYDIAAERPPVPLYDRTDESIQKYLPYNAIVQSGYVFCIGVDNCPPFSMPMLLEKEQPTTLQQMVESAVQELQTVMMPVVRSLQAVRVSLG